MGGTMGEQWGNRGQQFLKDFKLGGTLGEPSRTICEPWGNLGQQFLMDFQLWGTLGESWGISGELRAAAEQLSVGTAAMEKQKILEKQKDFGKKEKRKNSNVLVNVRFLDQYT